MALNPQVTNLVIILYACDRSKMDDSERLTELQVHDAGVQEGAL